MKHRHLIETGVITNFDPNLGRTTTYNDRISHWLGQSFTDALTAIGGRPLKHVYSFLCWHSMREGNGKPRLLPHTDREDNDYTISVRYTECSRVWLRLILVFHRFNCITMTRQVRRRGPCGYMEESFPFRRQAGNQSHRSTSPFKSAWLMVMLCCFADANTFTGATTCRPLRLHSLHFFFTLSIKNGTGRTSSSSDRSPIPAFEVRRSQLFVRLLPRPLSIWHCAAKSQTTKNCFGCSEFVLLSSEMNSLFKKSYLRTSSH